MYFQIEIEEKERSHFRLLWRDFDHNREPDVFELSRVVFGDNSASMDRSLLRTRQLEEAKTAIPIAADTDLQLTYMEDSIDCVENDDKGVEFCRQLE